MNTTPAPVPSPAQFPTLFPPGEPPISGEVQFWRMDAATWDDALGQVRDLGLDTIATYLSWRRHEPTPGNADLRGGHGTELNVHRFLDLCRDHRLRVILKPGPWICAEETNGGLPDWIVAQDDLLARDHEGAPVMGYNPPFKHPMPSYASSQFRCRVTEWITFVWSDLKEYLGPDGPIVATQYDNEPSLGFQDSMFGFDYHPEALASWNAFLGRVMPPPQPRRPGGGLMWLERRWIEWQSHYISDYLAWLRDVNANAGAPGLTGTVNLNTHPVRGMPQDGRVISNALPAAVVGEDHYFVPPLDTRDLAGLALAAAQAELTATPLIWAPEMQAGIWRSPGEQVNYPDPTVQELAGWWAAALALGYQGFNLYMLVNRDNWEHAPLGPGGNAALGQAARDLVSTMRSVPDLAEFRPVCEVTLPWNDDILHGAYRIRGTQADPVAPWDDPAARSAYDAVEERAVVAVELGLHIALDPASGPRSARGAFPEPTIQAPSGVLTRLHQHPDGRQLLYVIPWAAETSLSDVRLRLTSRPLALDDTRTGERHTVDQTGTVHLPSVVPGLNLFRVSPR